MQGILEIFSILLNKLKEYLEKLKDFFEKLKVLKTWVGDSCGKTSKKACLTVPKKLRYGTIVPAFVPLEKSEPSTNGMVKALIQTYIRNKK